jgi:hypothetical protein
MCEWETFEVHEKFLDEVRRKRVEVVKKMVFERKKGMCEKYLKEHPGCTIMRELNPPDTIVAIESLDAYRDCRETVVAYWTQNRG